MRPATYGDVDAIVQLLVRSIRETCGPDYGNDDETLALWCSNKTPEEVRRWLDTPDLLTLVAEDRDTCIVGVGQLSWSGEVLLCYVLPERLRHGIGTSLLERMEHEAKERGFDELTLLSTSTALTFYERRGFSSRDVPIRFGPGVTYPMHKRLA